MAFVYKSERDISPEIQTASGDIGPGQYLPQGFVRTKGKTSKAAGFDSNTYRDTKILKDDNPGPGSYTYDDKYEKFFNILSDKQSKSPSVLKSLEMVGPENLDPFTIIINKEKGNNVAFFSKEKRFKEKPGYDLPGPGDYSADNPMFLVRNSLKKKKRKNKNSKGRKKSANSLIRQDKEPISPYRVATIPSKNFCFGFDINSKGELYVKDDPDRDIKCFGDKGDSVGPGAYEVGKVNSWNKNGVAWEKQAKISRNGLFHSQEISRSSKININNSSNNNNFNLNSSNNYINYINNLNSYNNNNNNRSLFFEENLKLQSYATNNVKNFISPQITKPRDQGTTNPHLNPNLYPYPNSNNANINLIQKKNETLLSSQKLKYEKDKVFKHIRDKRQKLLEMKVSKSNVEDELFDKHIVNQDPGPGYYFSELATSSFNPLRVPEKFQYFGSNSMRFSDPNLVEKIEEVGPGAYFKDDCNLAKKKLKKVLIENNFSLNSQILRDEIKKERIETLEERIGISGIINQHKLAASIDPTPGPGNYEFNSENFNKKGISNIAQFGSLQKRFVNNESVVIPTPGPGAYLGMPKAENANFIKFPVRPKKIVIKKDETLQADLSIFPKEAVVEEIKANPALPGVGSYNPDIVLSLGYKVAKNVNKFNNSSAPFNCVEKRFNLKASAGAAENVGPGQYYKDNSEKRIVQNLLSNSPPFNTSAERKYPNEDRNVFRDNGPGSYNLSSYFDWNKKSFNVQFI